MEEIKARIRHFLGTRLRGSLRDEDDIFALGFVNSIFALELVLFLEKEFEITVENEDLELDNFRSIEAMASLVRRKTAKVVDA
jgi:methoxymalonate biosynthesis acyl carrier protein